MHLYTILAHRPHSLLPAYCDLNLLALRVQLNFIDLFMAYRLRYIYILSKYSVYTMQSCIIINDLRRLGKRRNCTHPNHLGLH